MVLMATARRAAEAGPTTNSCLLTANVESLYSHTPYCSRSADPLSRQPPPRQASLPLAVVEALRKGSILKTPSCSRSRSISRNSSRSTKTIRFQRQSSFDHGSYDDAGLFGNPLLKNDDDDEYRVLGNDDEDDEDDCGEDVSARRRATLLRELSSFTGDEIMSMKAAFAKLDCDGDGHLSHAEVHTALGEMMPEEDILSLLKEMDADGDGEIDYEEFLTGMKKKVKEPESVKMLKEAFRVFDSSGSGRVSSDYMRVTFLNSGSSSLEVEEMLGVLDIDQDGDIELEDFLRIFIDSPGTCQAESQQEHRRCVIL